jgi:hypothetical protein
MIREGKMKNPCFVFAVFFVLISAGAYGQAPPATVPQGAVLVVPTKPNAATQQGLKPFASAAQQARFETVKAYMRFPSPLQRGDQYCAGLGDEAAFFLYAIMVHSQPLSVGQTLTALDIIHKSFANPASIQRGQTRPVKSLALLKIIQSTAVDQTVKERITVETNFLNAVPATITPTPIGAPGQPPPAGPVGLF